MGLSRSDWTEAALCALAESGLAGVAVDPLARRLGATKGSFYWHFANLDELIAATLVLWEQRDTTEVIARLEAISDPRRRLLAVARFAYERAARGSGAQAGVLASASDPRVTPMLQRVTATRLAYLVRLYVDLGLPPEEAHRHARLAYVLYVGLADLHRAAPGAIGPTDEPDDVALMIEALTRLAGISSPPSPPSR
ncbi:MAG: TetR/AcrR family transcriptional regulator [Solirubrobacteraceae bacterium]